MSDEHKAALEGLGDKIIGAFGGQADPVERAKLIGAIELGQEIATFLQCEQADEDTWVDTGSDGGGYDCHVTIKGREYGVHISPGSTDAEDAAEYAEMQREESQWDLLCPRVIAALRAGPDQALADEFEAYVTPPSDSGSDRNGEDTEGG
jgi:hypothetical protein